MAMLGSQHGATPTEALPDPLAEGPPQPPITRPSHWPRLFSCGAVQGPRSGLLSVTGCVTLNSQLERRTGHEPVQGFLILGDLKIRWKLPTFFPNFV